MKFSGPNLGLMAEDSLERGLLLKGGDGLHRRTAGIASLADGGCDGVMVLRSDGAPGICKKHGILNIT